jgi:hypothetical protein
MGCNNKLTDSILLNCTGSNSDLPVKGLAGDTAVILNYADIDRSGSTTVGSVISNLVATESGVKVEWYKELASTATSYAANSEDMDGFSHSFLFRLPTTTAKNAERANELKNGLFVVVVPTKYQGVDQADTFKVYGWYAGLKLSELTNGSNENSGMLVTLTTSENSYENYPFNIFNEGTYAASKASFDSLFNPA